MAVRLKVQLLNLVPSTCKKVYCIWMQLFKRLRQRTVADYPLIEFNVNLAPNAADAVLAKQLPGLIQIWHESLSDHFYRALGDQLLKRIPHGFALCHR